MPHFPFPLRLSARRQYCNVAKFPFVGPCLLNQAGCRHPTTNRALSLNAEPASRRRISTSPSKQSDEAAVPNLKVDDSNGSSPVNKDEPNLEEFWRKIPMWKDVSADQFMSWMWNVSPV
jgi:hypothetical protein